MEGVELFQRENVHVPCLHLLSQIHVNELCLLIGGGVSHIEDGRLFLPIVHSSWKGDQDAMLRCMEE